MFFSYLTRRTFKYFYKPTTVININHVSKHIYQNKFLTISPPTILKDEADGSDGTSVVKSTATIQYNSQIDPLMATIKSANNSYELFNLIASKQKEFQSDHIMQTLKMIFALQKNGNTSIQSSQILKSSEFEIVCRSLKQKAPTLELNDVIEAIKILSFIGVSPNSQISMVLLNLIRNQINDITLGHIIFLDFLLRKVETTPLVEALKIALPMLFQIQLGTKMDHENTSQLTDLLSFVSRNRVSDQCVMNIVSALTMHGTDLTCDEAQSVIWSLTDLQPLNYNYDRLIRNAINILSNSINQLSFDALEKILSKLIDRYQQKYLIFYDERFYNQCAEYTVMNNVGFTKASFIQKKFNKVNFINFNLLNYLADKITVDPNNLIKARPTALFTYVTALSQANKEPTNWKEIQVILSKNELLSCSKMELPWIKFSLELLSLNYYNKELLDRILTNNALQNYLLRDNHTLDHLQLLMLYQGLVILHKDYDVQISSEILQQALNLKYSKQKCPLKTFVEMAFGGEKFVYNKVKTKFGHFIDHVVVFDKDKKEPIERKSFFGENSTIGQFGMHFEDITLDLNEIAIAIVTLPRTCYSLNDPQRLKGIFELELKTFKAIGIPIVCINLNVWSELEHVEKIPFIERETKFMIN